MKRALIVSTLVLTLAGCASTADFASKGNEIAANITAGAQTITQKVSSAKAYTLQACNYIPTSASLLALFNSSLGSAVGTVGEAICAAVRAAPFADGPANFRVNGIMVRGRFTR